jgi:predicted secreted protein
MVQNAETIDVRVKDIVEIPLEANVSAGFQWEVFLPEEGEVSIKLVGMTWKRTYDAVGAPQIQKFLFQASSAGSTKFLFHYKRPWEKKIKRIKVVFIKVH